MNNITPKTLLPLSPEILKSQRDKSSPNAPEKGEKLQRTDSDIQLEKNQAEKNLEKTATVFGQTEEDITKEFREYKALKLFKKFDCDLTQIRDNEELKVKIEEGFKYGFGNIVVNPLQVKSAKRFLKDKKVGVLCAVCYPFGEEIYGVKKYAVKKAFAEGADGVYLPVGVSDLKQGKIEQVKREFSKIVKKYKNKKVYALLELCELDFSLAEKIVKTLLKIGVSGIVSGSGYSLFAKGLSTASDLHSLSGGKGSVIALATSEKSRDVVSLFSFADRVFLKNAPKVAFELKSNLEF
ncbi:MAG: hypothetical protein IJY84_00710 [Clostridia bacterium]|nr:hypothetical protein [Clostridia bacterium]